MEELDWIFSQDLLCKQEDIPFLSNVLFDLISIISNLLLSYLETISNMDTLKVTSAEAIYGNLVKYLDFCASLLSNANIRAYIIQKKTDYNCIILSKY